MKIYLCSFVLIQNEPKNQNDLYEVAKAPFVNT